VKKGGEDHAIGRSRGGLSTKINALVDEDGLPVHLMLTAGQTHDIKAAPHLLDGLKCRHVIADRGHDADALLDLIRASGAKAHITSTRQRLVHRPVNKRIYRKRNLVERFFLQTQALQARCHPLRQARQKLPRCRRSRINQDVAVKL